MFESVISLDKPVVIKGKNLKVKLEQRIEEIQNNESKMSLLLKTEYKSCIEGSPKSENKRKMIKQLEDYKVQKIWLEKLSKVIINKQKYSLSINEATTLKIIE